MNATLTEILISIITLIATWFTGNKSVWGPRLGLVANICWWFYVVTFRRYGLIPMEAFFTVIGIRNLIKWEREK